MKIPVFVSCPTHLNRPQTAQRALLLQMLEDLNLEPRALGRSDYPTDLPLREVMTIAKHCSGGLILGFNQLTATAGVRKPGTSKAKTLSSPVLIPTAWNHLEAGILFALNKPLLVFKEPGVDGGVFDYGVTDVFIHDIPSAKASLSKVKEIREVFLKWRDKVGAAYYS